MGRPASFVLANSRSATGPGWIREENPYSAAFASSFSRGIGKKMERDLHGIWKERGARYQMLDGKILLSAVSPQIDISSLPRATSIHSRPDLKETIYSDGPELRQSILEEEAHDTLHEVAVALKIKKPERLSAKDLITLLIAALPNLKHCPGSS